MHGTPYLSDVIAGVSTHLISIRRRDQQRRSRHAGLEIPIIALPLSHARRPGCRRACARVPSHGGAQQQDKNSREEPSEGS